MHTNNHDMIIGLEVHVQLKTRSKLFCTCPTSASEPNTAVCPTCLGHPGSKPVMNSLALEFGTKLALALNCTLSKTIAFSRKTYFYPDMSKNFQITQYEIPLGAQGSITLDSGRTITISRLHLEEDPAALIHEAGSVLVDYNRSGNPLCEIVTAPDLHNPEEAREFMNKLVAILTYLDIFEPNSIIKADVNVSIKEKNFARVEIKNIMGFKEIERALFYEVNRQKQDEVVRETRGWNADKGLTYSMRSKETEEDYGYIIEPDLPLFVFEQHWIDTLKKQIPELPQQRSQRYVTQYHVDKDDAKIISADHNVAHLFETIAKKVNPVLSSKWIRRELLHALNVHKKSLHETPITADELIELFTLLDQQKITDRTGQHIMELLVEKKLSPHQYVETQGLNKISDENLVSTVCDEILAANTQAVADFKAGETKALKFLIGHVMAKMKSKGDPILIKKLLEEKLAR